MLLVAVSWLLGGLLPASAQISDRHAAELLEASPGIIREGYSTSLWPYQGVLWREVDGCWGGTLGMVGATSICLVCSIDDTSGLDYYRADRPSWGMTKFPSTSVGIYASYAYFTRHPEGWILDKFSPFAANYFARSKEPYHRANLNNLKSVAVSECRELHHTSGYE